MEESKQTPQSDYQTMLEERTDQVFKEILQTFKRGTYGEDGFRLIRDALKQTALESWRNGIEKGKRMASERRNQAGPSNRPVYRPSALQAGKLQRR